MYKRFRWGNLRERDHLGDPDVDGRIILRWIFEKWVGRYGLDLSGSGEGQVAGTCECGNEHSGSIKCGEFFYQPKTRKLLRKDSAAWSKYICTNFSRHLEQAPDICAFLLSAPYFTQHQSAQESCDDGRWIESAVLLQLRVGSA